MIFLYSYIDKTNKIRFFNFFKDSAINIGNVMPVAKFGKNVYITQFLICSFSAFNGL